MKKISRKNFLAITFVIAMLLISAATVLSAEQTENENDIKIKRIQHEEQKLEYNQQPVEIPKKKTVMPASFPIHDYPGNQLHPALAKSEYMGYMYGFKDEELGTIGWSASRGNVSYFELPGGDYPSLKLWDETTFYGTFVPDPDDSHGGIVYVFTTDFPEDASTYQLSGWDWSSLPDYPDEILWHDIIDTELSCNPSKENWEWGLISFVGSTNYDVGYENTPFITYQTSADGYATISWYQLEGCAHVDNVIDPVSLKAYSVYDWHNSENGIWEIFIRQDNYANWDEESVGYEYYNEDANYQYPVVSSNDDNIVIIAETDENENKDLVCLYGNSLENLESQLIFETPEDERYPQIRHFQDETFIATYVKNGNLYGIQTDDAGQTWSTPWQINENNGEVIEEYATSDLCEQGILSMWEEMGEDLDLWMDAAINNEIPNPPTINAPEKGDPGEEIEITVTADDPEGEDVYYFVDWGDGVLSGWIGPYESGETATLTHTWSEEKIYDIKARTKDENGLESEWSTTEINLPVNYNKPFYFHELLENFFERFPVIKNIFQFLQDLIQQTNTQ
jgi:hypothetical protein